MSHGTADTWDSGVPVRPYGPAAAGLAVVRYRRVRTRGQPCPVRGENALHAAFRAVRTSVAVKVGIL